MMPGQWYYARHGKTDRPFDQVKGESVGSKDDALSLAKQPIGKWKPGDRFFLMTDALGQWFLRRQEEKRKPWHSRLRRLADANPTALTAYVEQLRTQNEMKNDDVTLLVIAL